MNDPERHQPVLVQVRAEMKSFGIEHVTIQLERHDMASGESRLHQLDRRRS